MDSKTSRPSVFKRRSLCYKTLLCTDTVNDPKCTSTSTRTLTNPFADPKPEYKDPFHDSSPAPTRSESPLRETNIYPLTYDPTAPLLPKSDRKASESRKFNFASFAQQKKRSIVASSLMIATEKR